MNIAINTIFVQIVPNNLSENADFLTKNGKMRLFVVSGKILSQNYPRILIFCFLDDSRE